MITVQNNFHGAFRSIFEESKKNDLHCIFKSCKEGFGVFFQARKQKNLPNGLYLPP